MLKTNHKRVSNLNNIYLSLYREMKGSGKYHNQYELKTDNVSLIVGNLYFIFA
jgi:hypothetical protein